MALRKVKTGIEGLDDILKGGLVEGKPTLIKGGTGTGKTTLCLVFLHHLIKQGKHVTFITCDESPTQILSLLKTFSFYDESTFDKKLLQIVDLRPNLQEITTGQYSLDMVYQRINSTFEHEEKYLIIDSLQNLMLAYDKLDSKRDIFNIIDFFRESHITALITFLESNSLRHQTADMYEEFVSDCVIVLHQEVKTRFMTRNLRVIKYRGSGHGTSDYPFSITKDGLFLLPLSTSMPKRPKKKKYISTGIEQLDHMFGGPGIQDNSAMMITGGSGSGKTLFAAAIADAAMKQEKRVLYVSFEEAKHDLIDNLKAIGIDFRSKLKSKQLLINTRYAEEMELEQHLITIYQEIHQNDVDLVVMDSITAMLDITNQWEIKLIMIRFIAYLREHGVTILFTHLTNPLHSDKDLAVSSLVDHWLYLNLTEQAGHLRRTAYVRKSRGNAHSNQTNQIQEVFIDPNGIHINPLLQVDGKPVYTDEKEEWYNNQQTKLNLNSLELAQVAAEKSLLDKQQSEIDSTQKTNYELQKNNLLIKQKQLEQMHDAILKSLFNGSQGEDNG